MIEDEQSAVPGGRRPEMAPKAQDGQPSGGDAGQRTPQAGSMSGDDFQLYIGRGLRAVFDDVARQPIPDRFLDLMKKLG